MQMLLSKVLAAAALLALTAPASAKLYNLGDLLSPTTVSATTAGNAAGQLKRYVVREKGTTGRFLDTFKFTLSKDADVDLRRAFGGGTLGKNLNFRSVRIGIRDNSNRLVARVSGRSFVGQLASGTYKVHVYGKLKPTVGQGAYKFGGGAIAAPVPEPEEWALLMLGGGILAYQVRRKQRKLASTASAAPEMLAVTA